jgi:hypothetical protein
MPSPKFGKLAKKSDKFYRTLLFANYVTPQLPPPPASFSALDRIRQNIKTFDPSTWFPMDFNDRRGDCTIAAAAHIDTVFSGLVGKKSIASANSVLAKYLWLTHGVDSGLNELDVMNYFHKHTVFGDRWGAFVEVDPKNHAHVQLAAQIFGSIYMGFQVQENAVEDFQAGRTWTPGPLTQDGHAVVAVSYDQSEVEVLTWGGVQRGTWGWWDECVDESYAILPQEAQLPGFAEGFNYAQLQADLSAL